MNHLLNQTVGASLSGGLPRLVAAGFALLALHGTAAITYIDDEVNPESGWSDVQRIGWEITSSELVLVVEYQDRFPRDGGEAFRLEGIFHIDTDQDASTGLRFPLSEEEFIGIDYYLEFQYSSEFEWSRACLGRSGDRVRLSMEPPLIRHRRGAIEVRIPLDQIENPTELDLIFESRCSFRDDIRQNFTFEGARENREILADGRSEDWGDDTPDITDPEGDVDSIFGDVREIFTTDDATNLFFRVDLGETPRFHPEEGSHFHRSLHIYLDTDGDSSTGMERLRCLDVALGLGADHRITPGFDAWSRFYTWPRCPLTVWSETEDDWEMHRGEGRELVPGHTSEANLLLECSVPLAQLEVTESSSIPIFVFAMETLHSDHVPSSADGFMHWSETDRFRTVSNLPFRAPNRLFLIVIPILVAAGTVILLEFAFSRHRKKTAKKGS